MSMASWEYARENIGSAVVTLAEGNGPLRARLGQARPDIVFASENADELPPDVREILKGIHTQIGKLDSLGACPRIVFWGRMLWST